MSGEVWNIPSSFFCWNYPWPWARPKWGIVKDSGRVDRWTVALGMVPRGEVGLIFAGLGARLQAEGAPLLGPGLYAAVIFMVFVTTAMTPPLLMHRLTRALPLPGRETK